LSDDGSGNLIEIEPLKPFCRELHFEPGAVLRERGKHYRDMYLIAKGQVDVEIRHLGAAGPASGGTGTPIGEIGFLRGTAAMATVTARSEVTALVIDDATIEWLERDEPATTAQLYRRLAKIAEERTSINVVLTEPALNRSPRKPITVLMCRNEEMLRGAQQLRYEVYCAELGRQSPYADHEKRIIKDGLDATGATFIALEGDEPIGTLRCNLSIDGSLGVLEELYGMRNSPKHPLATCVCTKLIVRKSKRRGPASLEMIAAVVRYGTERGVEECYIDCIPALLPYYKAMGFMQASEQFLHRENGPSFPMALDVVKYGSRLSRGAGLGSKLAFLARAKAIKWIDRIWKPQTISPASTRG